MVNTVQQLETKSIRFSASDLDLFAKASGDRNPLHLCDTYARSTPYGSRVTFGILSALASFSCMSDRKSQRLANIQLQFRDAMFPGTTYGAQPTDSGANHAVCKITDGRRILLGLKAEFIEEKLKTPERGSAERKECAPEASRTTPVRGSAGSLTTQVRGNACFQPAFCLSPEVHTKETLIEGLSVSGTYAPDPDSLQQIIGQLNLVHKGITTEQIAILMCCSYIAGMRIPGKQALFLELQLDFPDLPENANGALIYEAILEEFDPRFNTVHIAVRFIAEQQTIATGTIVAALRPEPVSPDYQSLDQLLAEAPDLTGKVALVIGGSRGLGAALSYALARLGCTTYVNYSSSENAAQALKSAAKLNLLKADASDRNSCGEMIKTIIEQHEKIDYLICNACPAPQLIPFETESDKWFAYVESCVDLVKAPMAAVLPAISDGICVVISSSFVTEAPPPNLSHYVTAKFAIEGLTRAASAEFRKVGFIIPRPPRLQTDWNNAPFSRTTVLPVGKAAVRIIEAIANLGAAGECKILEW